MFEYNLRLMAPAEKPRSKGVRIRGIAIPVEHGSWGILLEPLVAGAAVAPSAAAPFIALLVIGAFLLRRPLNIYIADRIAGRSLPQTSTAGYFIGVYGLLAFAGLLGALAFTSQFVLLPFAVLLPLGVYQIFNDVARKQRGLVPEIAGAAGISISAGVLGLAAGYSPAAAGALWILFMARSIPSIVYVRQRLRLEKGKPFSWLGPAFLHTGALAVCGALASYSLIPYLPIAVLAFLLLRSVTGLSRSRKRLKAMQIGIREVIYGALLVLALVLGYYFEI